ncbi:hypothetical protein DFA_03777 [Cavenderia fasciculata]|uniref:E3 ubiquitin-protein ligase listerin n=1 Tax=Cavenderia fasciculata TaxID=261658 RepID=F4Q0D2_CACFS|nr:uncharacterized protein DFA_03777 [Cavenderia fasciculata]EGG18283.1 hypothetical protein DFA_03777 [Cavenderia fasciculata]|eukprot:XP_004357106.1 hypothetical protein DFA_03777 [Cavenderia fasciculata]
MGKDKGKNTKAKGANSWEAASNSGGFLGFSAFTSSLSNAIDTEFQIDSEYQVQFKKLQKKDEVSRMKALEELALLFSKIDVQNEQSNKSLLCAWELIFKRLVNDDHRRVREMTFVCLEIMGAKVGKLLAPHVRQLLGPWVVGICDQRDQQQNSALRAFESIFPEKKRRDVLLFGQEQAIQYLCENLQENVNTLGDGKATPPEVLQERYERLISNSLLAIEYLMEKTKDNSNNESSNNQSIQTIYQPIFESQFFTFLSSKSVVIRRTCYRLISGLVSTLPSYCEANMKDLSTKILGLFSEKDPSAHLFMWNAIISFLKKYKEQAWIGVDVRKHVLPRFWAFLRAGTFGSFDLSYPSILPFLSLIPDGVIGTGPEFFKEFFSALYKGLEVLENTKQYNDRPTNSLLSCYVECIYFTLKKWSNNNEIKNYVFGLFSELVLEIFGKEQLLFTESLALKVITSTLIKIDTIPTCADNLVNLFDQLTKQTQQSIISKDTTDRITNKTLCSRLSIFFQSTSSLGPTIQMSKELFHYSFNQLDTTESQDCIFEILSILLLNFNVENLLHSEIKDIKEFLNNIILKNIEIKLPSHEKSSIFNLLTLYTTIVNGNGNENYQESWNRLVQLLSVQQDDLIYLVKTIDSLDDRTGLNTLSLDQLVLNLIDSTILYQPIYNNNLSLFSTILQKIIIIHQLFQII